MGVCVWVWVWVGVLVLYASKHIIMCIGLVTYAMHCVRSGKF